jgi:microtubule-associated protein-like 6
MKINVWNAKYEQVTIIEVASLVADSYHMHVRALSVDEKRKKLAVGLYSNEVYEFDFTEAGEAFDVAGASEGSLPKSVCLVKAHFARNKKWTNEIWGLCLAPDGDSYFTCADDGIVRQWSTSKRKLLQSMDLNLDSKGVRLAPDEKTKDLQDCAKLRTLEVSPKGDHLIVGCYDGSVRIVQLAGKKWEQKAVFRPAKRWVSDIRFSPDGSKLAIGAHDAHIYIFEAKNFKLRGKNKKHSSAITHIDWSTDSNYIHSTCNAYELLFFDSNAKQITSGATALRNEDWATWTTTLGWPVQGIWKAEMDGSDINMVDRSHNSYDTGYRLLATADDKSKVNLYRYPCINKTSKAVVGIGHSSHVTCVRFAKNDSYLFTTGGEDQCVMQWKLSGLN